MAAVRWLFLSLVTFSLSACAGRSAVVPLAAPRALLPSVTPPAATATAVTPQVVLLPTAAPTATATPTLTPEVSDAGVRTASMMQLGLAAESYNTVGDPAAPLTIVEFFDYGCTFCRRHHLLNWPELQHRYIETGLVFYVLKDLPVSSRQGGRAAEAVGCAAEQDLAAPLRDALFSFPERWNVADDAVDAALAALVSELGGDGAALQTCLTAARYQPAVEADMAEAERLRLFGTPYFFINGRLLAGSQPLDDWITLLDAELYGGDVR